MTTKSLTSALHLKKLPYVRSKCCRETCFKVLVLDLNMLRRCFCYFVRPILRINYPYLPLFHQFRKTKHFHRAVFKLHHLYRGEQLPAAVSLIGPWRFVTRGENSQCVQHRNISLVSLLYFSANKLLFKEAANKNSRDNPPYLCGPAFHGVTYSSHWVFLR